MATKSKLLQAAAGTAAASGGANTDDNINQVTMLLHADGTDGDTNSTFLDSGPENLTVSRINDVTQSRFSPYGNRWSVALNAQTEYLSAPASAGNFGSSDFTVEFWLITTSTNQPGIVTQSDSTGGTGTSWGFFLNYAAVTGGVAWYMSDGTNYFSTISTGTTVVNDGKWHHLAACRSGSNFYLWIDGVSQGTSTSSTALGNGDDPIHIGGQGGVSTYTLENGYISDLRIVKGTALYTSSFDPPTEPLTAVSGTSLLTCNANRFKDGSSNNHTITTTGVPVISGLSPYAPTDNYIPVVRDVNAFAFDGVDDGVYVDGSAGLAFGTGDFTIECWVYINDHKDYIEIYDARASGDDTDHVTIYSDSSEQIHLYVNNANRISSTAGDLRAGEWNHFALVRSSGSSKIYLNGVQSGSTYSDSTSYLEPTTPSIGYSKRFTGFYMDGYISDFRVVKGTAVYTSTFTPPTSTLQAISGTSLLTCQDVFADNSGNNLTFTRVGDPQLTELTPHADYYSVNFDGDVDQISTPTTSLLEFGTSDFTVEYFVKRGLKGGKTVVQAGDGSTTSNGTFGALFGWISSNVLEFYFSSNGTSWDIGTGNVGTLQSNTWHHAAFTRSGNTWRVFFDGVLSQTITSSSSLFQNVNKISVGKGQGTNAEFSISNLRIVKGTALYTANFTPPTTTLTAVTNTSLLTCQANRIFDNSGNDLNLTVEGDTMVRPENPFDDGIPENIGSAHFDGTGDYLRLPNNDIYNFGTGDFTIDGWLYYDVESAGLGPTFWDQSLNGSNSAGGLWFGWYGDTFYFRIDGLSNDLTQGITIPRFQWVHVAVSRDNGYVEVYVNGNRQLEGSRGQNITQKQPVLGYNQAGGAVHSGYMADVRVANRSLYSGATLDVPTRPLPATPHTNTLLHFDNAAVFDSVGSNAIYLETNAKISTSSPKFGTGFLYFPDNTDYARIRHTNYDLQLDGDFTVELFFKTQSATLANNRAEFFVIGDTEDTGGVSFYIYDKNVRMYGASAIIYDQDASSYMNAVGEWNHLAYVRSGSTITSYMNGTGLGTATNSTAFINNEYDYLIGAFHYGSVTPITNRPSGQDLSIDELRVTRGVARYTSNFTPPTQAFPNK